MTERFFYVAMSKKEPGWGRASCIADIRDKFDAETVTEFFRDMEGHEIRKVNGDEMKRLMTGPEPSEVPHV